MRIKVLLAAFLLGVGLCFVPALGYGEAEELTDKELDELFSKGIEHMSIWAAQGTKPSNLELALVEARVEYVMQNPTTFLHVAFFYDKEGDWGKIGVKGLPAGVDTKAKFVVTITDQRGVFSNKHGAALLNEFEKQLKVAYPNIGTYVKDMDTDIVARFAVHKGGGTTVLLGYFYQGEYHLWER